jgi:wyosine [tRNA(Phe)-imidazoG37] synthetase (radical SAM superfamily)
MKTIFGPVPSRRLGRSLGIDVVPLKTCSYDCVYCESGRTTHLTLEREAFVGADEVLHELEDYFGKYPQGANVLTFSSGGEPTLYEPLGDLIRDVKNHFRSLPLIVLTNGSLLWDARVRRDLMQADRVVPSLDGATVNSFRKVNRPHPKLALPVILEGLSAFRREYKGQFHLEVMLVAGYNDHPVELAAIRRLVDLLDPHEVELNTVVRPPADPGIRGLDQTELIKALDYFPKCRSRIIGRFGGRCESGEGGDLDCRVIELLKRRPCTPSEMAASLGVEPDALSETLTALVAKGRLIRYSFDQQEFVKFRSDS